MSESTVQADMKQFVIGVVGTVCIWGFVMLHTPEIPANSADLATQIEAGVAAEGREAAYGRMMPSLAKRDRRAAVVKTVI